MKKRTIKIQHIVFLDEEFIVNSKRIRNCKRININNSLIQKFKNETIKKILNHFPEANIRIIDFKKSQLETDTTLLRKFREEIIDIKQNGEKIFFNINYGNLSIKNFIIDLVSEINGKVYVITDFNEVIFIPLDKKQKRSLKKTEKEQDEFLEYEDLIIESLQFEELNDDIDNIYIIPENFIDNTLLCLKKIIDDKIIIRQSTYPHFNYDCIKLVKINGIQFSHSDKNLNTDGFLKRFFEGLSCYDFRLIRLIINDKEGILFYLGIIESGKELKTIFKNLNYKFEIFINLIKSIYPGIEKKTVEKSELFKIIKFIAEKENFGCIIGHTSMPVSNRILTELENVISKENWGIITISEKINEKNIKKVIENLTYELKQSDSVEKLNYEEDEYYAQYQKMQLLKERIEYKYIKEIKNILTYFLENKDYGLWNTNNYFFSDRDIVYDTLYSIFKSNYKSIDYFWFPIKIIKIDKTLSQFVKNLQPISVERQGLIFLEEFKLFNTIYSSQKLADFIQFPNRSLKNFKISIVPEFATEFPKEVFKTIKTPIKMGIIKNSSSENNNFYIDLDCLVRHCLIMGSTGSGKTNTIMNILLSMWNDTRKIPFLIIEPIKKEFRHLLNYIKDLEIYTTTSDVNPIHINFFEVPPFLTYSQWVNELLEIICNTFYIWEPLRGVILNSLNDIYTINGWSENERGITPTMEDFIKYTKIKIGCSPYNATAKNCHTGAFENRFQSMIKGSRGIIFNVSSSKPTIEEILRKPTVIELEGLRNNDERALIFNFLMKKIYLYQQQLKSSNHLRHLIVVEEAHRLLTFTPKSSEPDLQTISIKAQESFSEILAEIRAYGEGIIISDQNPGQLNQIVVSNTNLKICHKMPSMYQILDFKDSLGLRIEHFPILAQLNPGDCIVKLENIDEPFIVRIDLFKNQNWGIEKEITDNAIKEHFLEFNILNNINYRIIHRPKINDIILIITELIFNENGREKIIYFPNKKACNKFLNFNHLFWNKMKSFYSRYKYCSACKKIIAFYDTSNINIFKNQVKCPTCNNNTKDFENMKVIQQSIILDSIIIKRKVCLDRLYEKQKELVPSDYSSTYINQQSQLKQDFEQILSTGKNQTQENEGRLFLF